MQIIPDIYLVGSQDCFLTYTDWYSPDCEYIDCNVFALKLTDQIILFDSGNGASIDQIFDNMLAWNLNPSAISHCFLTHPHFDHAAGASFLKDKGIKIIAHSICADAVQSGDARTCPYLYHRPFPKCEVDIVLQDEDHLTIGDLKIDALHTPGHADGSMVYSFQWRNRKICVTGDLVAESGSLGWDGGIDFNKAKYINSLKQALKLQPDVILPGHRRPALSRGSIWIEQALNKAIMNWGENQ